MPRYKLTIAYDGTDFCGWQKQEPPMPEGRDATRAVYLAGAIAGLEAKTEGRAALRTVQAVVEKAVRETVREPVELKGASRTDSGVHAKGQVAAFTCSPGDAPSHTGWPEDRGLDRLVRAINGKLEGDVQVTKAELVSDTFDPISHCTSKGYSYTLHASLTRPLWDRGFVQQVWHELDVDRMREGAQRLIGEHDFAAFAAASHGRQTTVRTIYTCDITDLGPVPTLATSSDREWSKRIRVDISGNGFLYNMVRIVAGTLVEVGRGKKSPEDVTKAIESSDRRQAGQTLPGQGLCLEWIKYE